MSRSYGLKVLLTVTMIASFSTTVYAGAKEDCDAGIKEVEDKLVQSSADPGLRQYVNTRLSMSKDASKAEKFDICEKLVAEMKLKLREQ